MQNKKYKIEIVKIVSILFLLLASCSDNRYDYLNKYKEEIKSDQIELLNESMEYFEKLLLKTYPNISLNDSYKQYFIDINKGNFDNIFFLNSKYFLRKFRNETDIFIKFKDKYKIADLNIKNNEELKELYILNTNSKLIKLLKKTNNKNLKKYLMLIEKENGSDSELESKIFFYTINQKDYEDSDVRLILALQYYYIVGLNMLTALEYGLEN